MTAWQMWKDGAEICAIVGLAAVFGYFFAGAVSGLMIILPVEVISGSASIEKEWRSIIYLLMVVVVPLFAERLMRSRSEIKNSNRQ